MFNDESHSGGSAASDREEKPTQGQQQTLTSHLQFGT